MSRLHLLPTPRCCLRRAQGSSGAPSHHSSGRGTPHARRNNPLDKIIKSGSKTYGATPHLYHLRQQDGRHEVALIIEVSDDRIIAIEIKAASAPSRTDARHLSWLREQLGDPVLTAVVGRDGLGRLGRANNDGVAGTASAAG